MRALALILLIAGCGGEDPTEGTRFRMALDGSGAFWDAPFPSDHRRYDDGTIDVSGFPNPDGVSFVDDVMALSDGRLDGFGTTSGIFFRLNGRLDPQTLPTMAQSVTEDATVFVIGLAEGSPDDGVRIPIDIAFTEDGGPFGDRNQLSLLPLQGRPLLPDTTYAAVVLRTLRDADGALLAHHPVLDDLPFEAVGYDEALEDLAARGIDSDDIAALAVFTTQDPTAELRTLVAAVQALPLPTPNAAFSLTDTFDDYCVYRSTVDMPIYQQGTPPFTNEGGEIHFDEAGAPILQGHETANLDLTVPRAAMPTAGWPTAVFIRTGGGGDRPLVDRGVRPAPGESPLLAGTGPAITFAAAGWAGASIDGPHGGKRNITGGDEQFLIFNIGNPAAMRDNIRQSALELTLMPAILGAAAIDVSDCPGADTGGGPAIFDTDQVALMGHSMGATIAPLVLAAEPAFEAGILSGAGGSWITNVVHKQSPLEVRPLAETMLHYGDEGRVLTEHDPVLTLLQWTGEAADPPVYGRSSTHVLMLQGIVDTYILPPIANTTSLAMGLDLGGDALDATHPELSGYAPLEALLPLVGGEALSLPISGNAEDGTTAVVVQHAEDGIEDGHEVVFQTEGPKHQYRCFLDSLRRGTPVVPLAAGVDAPCE